MVPQSLVIDDPIRAVAMLLGAPAAAVSQDPLDALAVELNVVAGGRRSKLTRCQAALDAAGEADLADILREVEL